MNTAPLAPRLRRPHPGWWLTVAATAAWILLGADVVAGWAASAPPHATPAGTALPMPDMAGMPMPGHDLSAAASTVSVSVNPVAGLGGWSAHWLLMVVAMMWPLYAAPAAAVARLSFRRWRAGTVGAYLGTITAGWLIAGAVARGGYLLVAPVVSPRVWSLAWLLVAAAATRSVWRTRLLRTCCRLGVVAPVGVRAVGSGARCGLQAWPRCALLCGPVMLAMVAAHSLPLMIGGSAAIWWEQRHPLAWRPAVPVVLLGVTAGALIVGAVWPAGRVWG
jgi:hypothetical protein